MPDYRPEWIETSDRRFGERVKAVRGRLGLSQQQLAETLQKRYGVGWHQTTLGKVERGERPVRLAEALAVAGALGVHVNDLLDQPQASAEDMVTSGEATAAREQSIRYHARIAEIEQLQRDLGRRERQLKHWLGRDVGWSRDEGRDDDGEHQASS